MPRSLLLSLPVIAGSLVGCGPEPAPPPPPPPGQTWDHTPRREYTDPGTVPGMGPAAADGRLGKILESFEIQVEEMERLPEGGVIEVGAGGTSLTDEKSLVSRPSNRYSLALKIRLTNHYNDLKFLIGPRRFWLETPNGRKIEPTANADKEPALIQGFLKGSSTTYGWLVFRVPLSEKKLTLISDLRRPQMEIPVTLPE